MNHPTIFSITEDEIDLNDLLARITLTSTGAAAIFTGMVRGLTTRDDAHETEYLEYEAYVPMAEAKMKQVSIGKHNRDSLLNDPHNDNVLYALGHKKP